MFGPTITSSLGDSSVIPSGGSTKAVVSLVAEPLAAAELHRTAEDGSVTNRQPETAV